jgi:hypothetical protein
MQVSSGRLAMQRNRLPMTHKTLGAHDIRYVRLLHLESLLKDLGPFDATRSMGSSFPSIHADVPTSTFNV